MQYWVNKGKKANFQFGQFPTVGQTLVAVNFHQHWVFFTDFPVNSESIFMKFHASTLFNYSGAYPENFVKYERVFQKLDHLTSRGISWVKLIACNGFIEERHNSQKLKSNGLTFKLHDIFLWNFQGRCRKTRNLSLSNFMKIGWKLLEQWAKYMQPESDRFKVTFTLMADIPENFVKLYIVFQKLDPKSKYIY